MPPRASTGDIRYELDREDRIRSVDPPWAEFARENGAGHLADAVVGTSIWDWIAGAEVRHLYRQLFSRIRETGGSTRFPFRCDSPALRRFMELEISALAEEGLRCTTRLVRTEQRPPVPLLDPNAPRSGELLAMCAWCKRVRASRELWLEVEQATSELRLLETAPPAITHTICPDCAARIGEP